MKAFEPPALMPEGRENKGEIIFLIAVDAGVWTVTKDGEFYGDYLKEEHARASAQCAVAAILEKGGNAKACLIPTLVTGDAAPPAPITLDAVCERPSRYPAPEASQDTLDDTPRVMLRRQ